VFQNKKNKQKPLMSDIKPNGFSGGFSFGKNNEKLKKDSQAEHESFLIEALREDEDLELLKIEEQKIAQKNRELEIKKEACSFNSINFNRSFIKEEIPVKIVSEKFSREYLEKKQREKIEAQKLFQLEKEEVEKKALAEELKRQKQLETEKFLQLQKKAFERIIEERKCKELELKKNVQEKSLQEQLKQESILQLEQIENKKRIQIQKQREIELKYRLEEEARREKFLIKDKKRGIVIKERLKRKISRERKINQIKQNLLAKPTNLSGRFGFLKPALAFSGSCLAIFMVMFSLRFFFYGIQIKDQVVVKGASVVADLEKAKSSFQDKNFSQIVSNFQKIQKEVGSINEDLEQMEGGLPEIISKLPFVDRYGSAKKVLEAGNEIAQAMVLISQSAEEFSEIEKPLNFEKNQDFSLGVFFLSLEKKLISAENHFKLAQKSLEAVDIADLPKEYQMRVATLKENFPKGLSLLTEFNQKQVIFRDLLGYGGPRKYLFLFQNNHELRATGGFIGSYGVLDVHNGNVKNLFIDGIFNPDGQLSARVVPPRPIQKISTNWSTHDANWFPDFPTSAEKIAWFYEKTGGPTVDGIITLTPTVMEKLLTITGPIEMIEYGVTVDSKNFVEATQFEVEEDYDKTENRPKKFIADLTPKILEQVFSKEGLNNFPKTLQILSEALAEKHILLYSENSEIQSLISDLGWSGEILDTSKDYLMVINSNINGYKTDGVIDQEINHQIEIEEDGSVVDTVVIERTHNGGSSSYEWWNKVNANYMRVYVPEGSEFLSAEGSTRETVDAPVNYDKLGFDRDEQVVALEKSIRIDKESGTEIWEEQGKTVFANWVYVSPQEKVRVSYRYKLPFKLDLNLERGKMDTYSVLYQKQSGMNTSVLKTKLKIADEQEVFWQYPDELQAKNGLLEYNSNLERDRFLGVVLK